jgi:inorganic pyrophosphatase
MESKYSVYGANSGLIIEAENLVALELLVTVGYAGKIDVIPIDPPYNTAIAHIKYKDADFEDGWRTFMELRLRVAYKLLSDTGTAFIHIDENELFNLMTLCADVFGAANVNILVWKKVNELHDANRIEKPTNKVRLAHEYVVVCYKDKTKTQFNKIKQPLANGTERVQFLESILDGFGTTASAKDELAEFLGNREIFATPKPMRLIKEFIRAASGKNAVVLDFFAGSGTTGHAVMDLNQEDGCKRKFILITNNESNICRDVTIPRIQKVIAKYGYIDKFKVVFSDERTVIGMAVDVLIDRPIGTEHPKRKGILYPINYGYIDGMLAGDNEEQDVYILGINQPIKVFKGKIIAIVRRFDDVENKWVAAPEGKSYSKAEIQQTISFQERYYKTEILQE